jgi:F0F1-type ATP synthase membrane subunit b/b'
MRRCIIALLAVLALCGPIACRSTQGSGQIRATEVNKGLTEAEEGLDQLEQQVEASAATPEQKQQMKSGIKAIKPKITEAKPVVQQLGKDTDNNQEIAISNAAAAKAMHLVLALTILAIIGAFLLWRSRKNKSG